jgi:hypothetical protein
MSFRDFVRYRRLVPGDLGGARLVEIARSVGRRVCVALCLCVLFGSCCRWWLRVLLVCSQLVLLSCFATGDSALWGGIWRRPVPSSGAGGDDWCSMRAVGWLGTSFMWVGTGEPLMLAYMGQSAWVGKVEGGLGGARCMLMRSAVRQTRVATGGQASEHRARAAWVNMLLCARWKVTHLFSLLRMCTECIQYIQ